MEVITAKTAGFCFGVERAVDMALKAAKSGGEVYTLGPIVHNESVVEMLEEQGVHTLRSEDEAALIPDGAAVLIRAHGIPKALEETLRKRSLRVIDATCPFVKKIHRIAEEHSAAGETVVIAGNAAHPEVVGIRGYCSGPSVVISEPEEIEKKLTDQSVKLCLVVQTTFNHKKFKFMVEKLQNLRYNATIADTVCSATRERQEESEDIASRADAMIVIGGKESSNSQKLYEICKRKCNQTYFIQTAAELKDEWWCGVSIVGITAGASTPKTIIKEVQTNVRKF